MSIVKSIRALKHDFELLGVEAPVMVEVGEKTAKTLNEEVQILLKYSEPNTLRPNEAMLYGVLIVAPRNFVFTRETPTKEEWLEK